MTEEPTPIGGNDPIDPDTDARVRALLADLSDPGPMPADVAARIEARLRDEAAVRDGAAPVATLDAHRTSRIRSNRLARLVLATAAAAALVIGSGTVLLGKGSGFESLVGGSTTSADSGATPAAPEGHGTETPADAAAPSSGESVRVTDSGASVSAATLPAHLAALTGGVGSGMESQSLPVPRQSADGPTTDTAEQFATKSLAPSYQSCLAAVAAGTVPEPTLALIDLVTWDNIPAAILVADTAGARTAYVVTRDCTAERPGLLHGPVPMP